MREAHLDRDAGRLVNQAVGKGRPVADPALAPVVVSRARRQQLAMALLLASAVIGIAGRLGSLASHDPSPVLDLVTMPFFVFLAGSSVFYLLRAWRAVAANQPRHR